MRRGGRRGFTLLEILIVVSLMAMFLATATEGFASWRRRAARQATVCAVVGLLKRAAAETMDRSLTYKLAVEDAGAGHALVGARCEFRSAREATYVPDDVVPLDDELPVVELPAPDVSRHNWRVEGGATYLQPGPVSAPFVIRLVPAKDSADPDLHIALTELGEVQVLR